MTLREENLGDEKGVVKARVTNTRRDVHDALENQLVKNEKPFQNRMVGREKACIEASKEETGLNSCAPRKNPRRFKKSESISERRRSKLPASNGYESQDISSRNQKMRGGNKCSPVSIRLFAAGPESERRSIGGRLFV